VAEQPSTSGSVVEPPRAELEAPVAASRLSRLLGGLARWEVLLLVVVAAFIWIGASVSPVFLAPGNFGNLVAAVMEVAIMSLPMALVIIVGEIDLSVESMAGLSAALLGFLFDAGVPLPLAIVACVAVGALGGLFNGLLVTRAGLPSLVVTLGTLALYRGIALIILGPRGISGFPSEFTTFGFGSIPGTPIPWPFLIYAGLALVLGFVLHRTWIGRQLFAIGKNVGTAQYSGVRVQRIKLQLFVLSGTVAAIAGVLLAARFASARADLAQGMTLTVVTIVLLGGVNIFGGRGTIVGVALAALALALLGNVLRLTNVSAEIQSISVGGLLIVSVLVPNLARRLGLAVKRVRGTPPARAGPGL
jgi:rhamnose transport system permease protein